MDILDIDPEVLFSTADAISAYCAKQRETINVYYAQIRALEDSWQDDKTFGSIVDEITLLRTKVTTIIEEINDKYPKYFRLKAQEILDRPSFDKNDIGTIKVIEEVRVPPQTTPYYGDYSRASYGGDFSNISFPSTSSYSTTGGNVSSIASRHSNLNLNDVTDRNYINRTFNVTGNNSRLNSVLQTSFANAPQSLMEGVYRTTDRLEFAPSGNGCYYDPCGVTQSSIKSVIGVDFNSPTLGNDIVSLVAQHVFYYADDADYYDMLSALKEEGNNNALEADTTYLKYLSTFKQGVVIPDEQTDEKLLKKSYKTAARFFVECFNANVKQDEKAIKELQRLFPKSYQIAITIIEKKPDSLTWDGN